MIPPFLYGTAWKEDATERCVLDALRAGFRGIDTANQRKHYFEAGVGAAIVRSGIDRNELFLQTKFTYRRGQDHRLPYDPKADPATQVQQSFASSLEHLRVDRIDSYVLHGPGDDDRIVWRAMESLPVPHLGISNVSLDELEELMSYARIKPTFVQNRCYARFGWDREVRAFCAQHGIRYQGFSLLTANVAELRSARFREIVTRTGKTPAQIVFRFAMQVGMLPLTGTTDPAHMREDLEALSFELSESDVRAIETISG